MKLAKRSNGDVLIISALVVMALTFVSMLSMATVVGHAENFTDIFYTNSFRGAFNWIRKFDWVGMIVQAVISCFSLFGVALLVIRIMTSMLYLSAKGMWDEVHEHKGSSGGEGDGSLGKLPFGVGGMMKTWVSGKAGTGLDAVIGAVLVLLPDVKRYSDFSDEHKNEGMDENMTMNQYILKIALPTVMTVFFFAMGFNGTLFQALAVSVDLLGSVADKAVSVNYAGYVDSIVNSVTGYTFTFGADGTNYGKLKDRVAKDLFARAVAQVPDADAAQLYAIGRACEEKLNDDNTFKDAIKNSSQIADNIITGLKNSDSKDKNQTFDGYIGLIGYDTPQLSTTEGSDGCFCVSLTELLSKADGIQSIGDQRAQYVKFYFRQTKDVNSSYFNFGTRK